MMAHDSSGGSAVLAEETIAAVRAALVRYVDAPSNGDELRSALHAVAADARAKSVAPEQLLVALKDIWYSLPVGRSRHDPTQQIQLLQRVVTMCIKEYYAD